GQRRRTGEAGPARPCLASLGRHTPHPRRLQDLRGTTHRRHVRGLGPVPKGPGMTRLDGSRFGKSAAALADADPSLARVIQRAGLPASWPRPPGFAALVLYILEQLVSLASARAVIGRLV